MDMGFGNSSPTVVVTVLVLLWVLCGLLAGTIAAGKNRSYGRWLLAGLLLGPVGVVWAMRRPEYIPPEEARPCPRCGRTIRRVASECPYCRAWVADRPKIDQAAQIGYVAGKLWRRARQVQRKVRARGGGRR
jgi:hypothetical protein